MGTFLTWMTTISEISRSHQTLLTNKNDNFTLYASSKLNKNFKQSAFQFVNRQFRGEQCWHIALIYTGNVSADEQTAGGLCTFEHIQWINWRLKENSCQWLLHSLSRGCHVAPSPLFILGKVLIGSLNSNSWKSFQLLDESCPTMSVTFQNRQSNIHTDFRSDWPGAWRK